jgi:DNA-binding NarL/FixJ family response regulator
MTPLNTIDFSTELRTLKNMSDAIDSQPSSDIFLPRIVYLHVDYKNSACAAAEAELQAHVGYSLAVCSSWVELIHAITPPNTAPQAVLIHLHSLRTGPGSVADITSMIKTVMAIYGLEHKNNIGIVVDDEVDLAFVKELKKSNILNIVPGVGFRGVEESAKATMSLITGVPYILNVIKSELVSPLPRVVSFWSKPIPHLSNSIKKQLLDKKLYSINFCDTWDTLADAVAEPTDLVVVHSKMSYATGGLLLGEIIDMVAALVRYTSGTPPKIAVVIDKDTHCDIIKELRKTDACGIIPSSAYWGPDTGSNAVVEILTNGSYWPKDIIAQLPGNITKLVKEKPAFQLTSRQREIVNLISTRGLSNKRIAGVLHIAESTVKIHVSAALKVYGVRTRTQLALVANK